MRILIVEDSDSLRETLKRGLRKAGFKVDVAADGDQGLDAIFTHEYDLVILDLMLPGCDGMEVLREMRTGEIDAEVLILTARATIEQRVAGLEAGADDYLVKPFAFEELLARVRALVRRRYGDRSNQIKVGDLLIDTAAGRMMTGDQELMVQPREFILLELLARRDGEVVSRTEILEHVYDHAVDLKSNAIDSAVSKLRKALREAGSSVVIRTVPRRGYLLESAPSEVSAS